MIFLIKLYLIFFQKFGKMLKNLSFSAVVIGALMVKSIQLDIMNGVLGSHFEILETKSPQSYVRLNQSVKEALWQHVDSE